MAADSQPPLGSTLDRAKATLKHALVEACHADVDRLNTGELVRIEEVLTIATEAAREAISLRRRQRDDRQFEAAIVARPRAAESHADAPTSREIEDAGGVRWAVFAVYPSLAADRASVREQFRDGWLSFDSGAETRRLAPIPHGWQQMDAAELLRLCENAERASRRGRTTIQPQREANGS